MIKNQLFIAAAMLAGVAIGFFVSPNAKVEAASSEAPEQVASAKAIASVDSSAEVELLKKRVRELESQLQGRRNRRQQRVGENEESERGEGGEVAPRDLANESPRRMMSELERRDPERYAQMTNNFARWRQERTNRQRSKIEFLSSIDTSGMSPAARQAHGRLQQLLAQREEIEDQMMDPDLPWNERGEIFRQMREADREISDLNKIERETLLNETAKALGLKSDDAAALSQTVQDILEVTENNGPRRGPRGPGGPNGTRGGSGQEMGQRGQ